MPSDDSDSHESSGEEGGEGNNNDEILNNVFAGYDSKLVSSSRAAEAIQAGKGSPCLICISGLKRNDAAWSCDSCFCTFHLNCIQQWANDCIFQQKNQLELAGGEEIIGGNTQLQWACPKCRFERSELPRKYTCYCGKVDDPAFDPWILPHSCGETCGKPLKGPSTGKCGHKCLILCHPGPCPPCPVVSHPLFFGLK